MSQPDVLGLSCYVWNWKKQCDLGRRVKEKFPECIIVLGGPHVPRDAAQFMQGAPWADILVHGEGEIAFTRILKTIVSGSREFSAIPGLTVRDRQGFRETGAPERLPREIDVESPYLAGYFDQIIDSIHARGHHVMARVEMTRGCPYRCSYCDWGSATNSNVRHFDFVKSCAEFEYLAKRRVYGIYCVDANTGMFEKDVDIARALVDVKNRYGYPHSFFSSMAKNSNERVLEISRILHEAGLLPRGGNLSMQSLDDGVLSAIDRKMIGTKKYMELKARYWELGIPTLTEIILGLPGESKETFKAGLYRLLELGFHEGLQVFPLIILPNAPMANPEYIARYGIRWIERKMFDRHPEEQGEFAETVRVVVETKTMPEADWLEMNLFANLMMSFHAGGPLRYLAQYVRERHEISYEKFYGLIFEKMAQDQSTVMGEACRLGAASLARILSDEGSNFAGYTRFELEVNEKFVEMSGSSLRLMWLYCALRRDRFFAELEREIESNWFGDQAPGMPPEFTDAIRFQKELWLQLNYDPDVGKVADFAFDWPHYFQTRELRAGPCRIQFGDRVMGAHTPIELKPYDIEVFAKATQSMDPAEHRRYIHQFDKMSIEFMSDSIRQTKNQAIDTVLSTDRTRLKSSSAT